MKIVIPGGSGQVGTILARSFANGGDDVVVLSRSPENSSWRSVAWDGESLGDWVSELEAADVVINMAGRSVNCRYTPRNRRAIMESRLKSTQILGEAIAQSTRPPRAWLQASTATIYAHRYDAPHDESTGIIGGAEPNTPDTWRFSIDVATSWERVFNEAATPRTRKVLLRSAIIMSPLPGGPFDLLLRLVRFGLGGTVGDGKQYVSWVHDEDFVSAIRWIIERTDLDGPINVAAPNPLINAEFMSSLRAAWGVPIGLPAPEWLLEIGAFMLRSESELALKSRRVVPGRLLASGFRFDYPIWPDAASDLCSRWRNGD
ncbi:MAG TPA: TIGR01777 family oxidoreductase [Pyrinomonadaceae bacterium]|nr:TIGR01777 family oxidoreductase [Pyrinomonadaceae bacterium]